MGLFLRTYVGLYSSASLVSVVLVWRRASFYRERWALYRPFLFARWKWITFLIAATLLTAIAPLTGDPTWDYADSIFMSALTFLTAPWSVGVLFRRRSRFDESFVAACLWGFSAFWSYDLYIWWRDGLYPLTWYANVFASSLLYLSAGLFWNLEWRKETGVVFGFTQPDWPAGPADRFEFRRIVWAVVPLMALVSGIIAPFVRQWVSWEMIVRALSLPAFLLAVTWTARAAGLRRELFRMNVFVGVLWLGGCSVLLYSLGRFQKTESAFNRVENEFGADIVVPPGMTVADAETEGFDAWLRAGSTEPDLRLRDIGGPGMYKVAASLGGPVTGPLELRIFEATKNTPIPYQHDRRWTTDGHWPTERLLIEGYSFWRSEITIVKGGYKRKYPARFELWSVDTGKKNDKLVLQKTYWINGWLR